MPIFVYLESWATLPQFDRWNGWRLSNEISYMGAPCLCDWFPIKILDTKAWVYFSHWQHFTPVAASHCREKGVLSVWLSWETTARSFLLINCNCEYNSSLDFCESFYQIIKPECGLGDPMQSSERLCHLRKRTSNMIWPYRIPTFYYSM